MSTSRATLQFPKLAESDGSGSTTEPDIPCEPSIFPPRTLRRQTKRLPIRNLLCPVTPPAIDPIPHHAQHKTRSRVIPRRRCFLIPRSPDDPLSSDEDAAPKEDKKAVLEVEDDVVYYERELRKVNRGVYAYVRVPQVRAERRQIAGLQAWKVHQN
jgi:hypothetical protein